MPFDSPVLQQTTLVAMTAGRCMMLCDAHDHTAPLGFIYTCMQVHVHNADNVELGGQLFYG